MKPSKMRNVRTEVDGIKFASEGESERYKELKWMQAVGEIRNLKWQHSILIAPGVKIPGAKRASPPIRYVADFCYNDAAGELVIEDFKGFLTPMYKLKRHLLALKGIFITEIRRK